MPFTALDPLIQRLRRVEDLDAAANARAFARTRLVERPANNPMLVYRRQRSISTVAPRSMP
ncbi:MAG TPA: hypothetical protein VML58_06890 [Burkholderiaceae bacterium]|nr:hypothetical protein [Burkholderiaceae bacterium]